MKKDENLSFEEALERLEQSADMLKKEGVSLEDAIKGYQEGIANYKICSEILKDAKQKIEIYSVEKEQLK